MGGIKYSYRHQQERKTWVPIVNLGGVPCHLCDQEIEPGTKWHLSHRWSPEGFPLESHPAHARCNCDTARTDFERDVGRTPAVGPTPARPPALSGTLTPPPTDGTWAWCEPSGSWVKVSREWR
ncbi:hypothetical protein QF034_001129 [Streptomyces africanus]|uniref:HNH endonuclease n=1 Tax=Streptomyces africanus TaxID=231024 RepID=A0ABU0QHP2_9ACTN|nr:hypothetical protein [Streptomyces africanus]